MSNLDFGVPIIGEWNLTVYTVRTSPTQTISGSSSIFFRADNTFSSSSMTAASAGTWRQLGNFIAWQYPLANFPMGYPDPPSLPNIFTGNKTGFFMSGLMWNYRRPDQQPGDGYWYATKAGVVQGP